MIAHYANFHIIIIIIIIIIVITNVAKVWPDYWPFFVWIHNCKACILFRGR